MKYLRKFDSVEAMNTAIASSEIDIMGLAFNNGQPVLKNKQIPIQPNDEIWYTATQQITIFNNKAFGANVVSHTYSDGNGVIKFDGNVTSIGYHAFMNQYGMTSIGIPQTATSIGEYAFAGVTSLQSIVIPAGVTSIADNAFDTGLRSIKVDSGNSVYDSRNDCNALIHTSTNTIMKACPDTVIPNNIQHIGRAAFTSLGISGNLVLPDGLISIGEDSFTDNELASVTIPSTVTSIGAFAFMTSGYQINIYCLPATPPTIGEYAFGDDLSYCGPIYVPAASVDTYKAASNWSTYATLIQAIPAN